MSASEHAMASTCMLTVLTTWTSAALRGYASVLEFDSISVQNYYAPFVRAMTQWQPTDELL
jgi:hypothetical protein